MRYTKRRNGLTYARVNLSQAANQRRARFCVGGGGGGREGGRRRREGGRREGGRREGLKILVITGGGRGGVINRNDRLLLSSYFVVLNSLHLDRKSKKKQYEKVKFVFAKKSKFFKSLCGQPLKNCHFFA